MKLKFNNEIRIWSVYFLTIILVIYVHELGHCIPAWLAGVKAIPTPAKEYIAETIPAGLQQQVSVGGILGTVLSAILIMIYYLIKRFKYAQAVMAGAIAMPLMYSFRFLIAGRGHDATEFQEAQAALGLNYSGHFIDWVFLALVIAGCTVWILREKPKIKIAGRLLVGFILTLIFTVVFQTLNNAIFDPLFQI